MTRLEAIRQRLKNATPGPWRSSVEGPYEMRVAETDTMNVYASVKVEIDMQTDDAELIAHAPDDLRTLLACVDEMRGALKEISSVSTYYDNTLHMCVTATETLTSIEEKLR